MPRPAIGLLVLALLTLSLALPTTAARAQDAELPALAEITSMRVDYVATFNGEPGIVCQDEWASASRFHSTCLELVDAQFPEIGIDFVAGRVSEYVYYDGIAYSRLNDETVWLSAADPNYDPNNTLINIHFSGYTDPWDAVVTNVGRVDVGGTPATQYQFWSLDTELNEESGGQYVYDVFVSDEGFVLKDQVSNRGNFPMGEGELAFIWTYRDFNTAISVAPPPAESVSTASVSGLRLGPSVLLHR